MKSTTNSKTSERKAGAADKANFKPVARRSTSKARGWQSFSDAELVRAVELMIAPGDLAIRGAALAVLKSFSYTPSEVREQLDGGERLSGGPAFDGLAADAPRIVYPEA